MTRFNQFVGQRNIVALLKKECAAPLPRHTLLSGPPGLGKTTLAGIMARAAGMELVTIQAGQLATPKKIAQQLMDLGTNGYSAQGAPLNRKCQRHLVFIDEAHALKDFEQWYGVLTSRELNPDPYGGVSWLPFLTVVAATNYPDRLPKPFKDRFSLQLRLEPYSPQDLKEIVKGRYPKLDPKLAAMAVERARGSARSALDLAETVKRHGPEAFAFMQIDERGLSPIDHAYLAALANAGRPLSLNTIAGMIQEDARTVEKEIEPYLLRLGLIARTSKGRELIGSPFGRSRGNAYAG